MLSRSSARRARRDSKIISVSLARNLKLLNADLIYATATTAQKFDRASNLNSIFMERQRRVTLILLFKRFVRKWYIVNL